MRSATAVKAAILSPIDVPPHFKFSISRAAVRPACSNRRDMIRLEIPRLADRFPRTAHYAGQNVSCEILTKWLAAVRGDRKDLGARSIPREERAS